MPRLVPTISPCLALLLAGAVATGCGGAAGAGPGNVVDRYAAAVAANRPDQAYALLHPRVRRSVSKAEFKRRWNSMRAELRQQSAQLKQRPRQKVNATAVLTYGDGVRMRLVYGDDRRWSLDSGLPVLGPTPTPAAALRALLQAVEQNNTRLILRLLSRSRRNKVERRLQDWIIRLRQALQQNEEIEVSGKSARLRFGGRYSIELVQQDGQWKVYRVKY